VLGAIDSTAFCARAPGGTAQVVQTRGTMSSSESVRTVALFLEEQATHINRFADYEVALGSEPDAASDLGEYWFAEEGWNAPDYRFVPLGIDGSGGLFAVWLRPGASEPHPVVFFGSEGEYGVLTASILGWVQALAHGTGVAYRGDPPVRLSVDENDKLKDPSADVKVALASYRDAVERRFGPLPPLSSLVSGFDEASAEFCSWVASNTARREQAEAQRALERLKARDLHDVAVETAFAAGLRCPRCGSTELRLLTSKNRDAAVVCQSCGRSFDPAPEGV
jgi:hypothetical protein